MCGVPRFNGDSGTVAIYQCAASNLARLSNYISLSSLLFPGNGGALTADLHLYVCHVLSLYHRTVDSCSVILSKFAHYFCAYFSVVFKRWRRHRDIFFYSNYMYYCIVVLLFDSAPSSGAGYHTSTSTFSLASVSMR